MFGYLSFNCDTPETLAAEQFQFNSSSFYASPSLTLWLRLQNDDATNTSGTMEIASLKMPSNIVGLGEDVMGPGANTTFEYSKCSFQNTIVTAYIICISGFDNNGFCSVSKIQQYNGTNQTSYQAHWNVPAMQSFLQAVPDATIGSPTLQELYLTNPSTIISGGVSDFTNLTGKIFTDRIQVLVNTFYQVSGGGSAFTEGLKTGSKDTTIFSAAGYYVDESPTWVLSISWTVIFFICNTTILLLAIVDIVCRIAKVSPDFLAYGGSTMRSKYWPKDVRGTKISGYRKAKSMRGQVILQGKDRRKGGKRVTLAPKTEDSERLSKDIVYRWR